MDKQLQEKLQSILLNSKYGDSLCISFDDDMVICHKVSGSRIDFEKAVGDLIGLFNQKINKYGLVVEGRNGAGICLGNGDLGLKLVKTGQIPNRIAPDMRDRK